MNLKVPGTSLQCPRCGEVQTMSVGYLLAGMGECPHCDAAYKAQTRWEGLNWFFCCVTFGMVPPLARLHWGFKLGYWLLSFALVFGLAARRGWVVEDPIRSAKTAEDKRRERREIALVTVVILAIVTLTAYWNFH